LGCLAKCFRGMRKLTEAGGEIKKARLCTAHLYAFCREAALGSLGFEAAAGGGSGWVVGVCDANESGSRYC